LLLPTPKAVVGQEGGRVAITSDTTYGCIVCHSDKRRAFIQGVHSERGIRCDDCHGGDPLAFEIADAHAGPFVGSPGKIGTVEVCGSCHSSVELMRQYGISADQVAELRSSRHGQLLLGEGNLDAPTCTDCHDAHTILRPDDARSNTYPTAIPATCGRCHEDGGLMATYGLPTSQFEEYRSSAHGHALFEEENFSAPSCIGCHGSHAALPPAVSEISNVCGQCHVLVRDALAEGVHGAVATEGAAPGCTGCHSNHSTEPVPTDGIAETCTGCHEAGSQPVQMGAELQDRVVQATQDMDQAEHALEELGRAGYRTADLRFRLQTARTSYERISLVQHSLDLEALEDLSLRVSTVSRDIRSAAEVAAEHRWEHRLFLIPVWFFALSAIALGIFKMREAGQETD
jgi:hypothetical protein